MISIIYSTFRKDPKIEWFISSLRNQISKEPDPPHLEVIVVSPENLDFDPTARCELSLTMVRPKPCVWQGAHRRTKRHEYFAASNTRNTGMISARGDYLVFVDDLSVLMPGWLRAVLTAAAAGYVVLGAYKKVRNLIVSPSGWVESFTEFPEGVDSRWSKGGDAPVPFPGSALFGCSFGVPASLCEKVNGFDEAHDRCGGEDCDFGHRLSKAGAVVRYDRSMMTLESEDHHRLDDQMIRIDPKTPGSGSLKDMSHVLLSKTMRGGCLQSVGNNFFLEEARAEFQRDGTFPPCPDITHDPITGIPLEDM